MSETIAFMFIVLQSDVPKLRRCTSESAEHTFGMLRQIIREFTFLEFAQLVEKQTRRLKQMHRYRFCPSRDPSKSYRATYEDFYDYTCDSVDGGKLSLLILFFCL